MSDSENTSQETMEENSGPSGPSYIITRQFSFRPGCTFNRTIVNLVENIKK